MKKSKSKAKIHRTHTRNNDIQTLTIRIDLERQDKADLDYLCHSLGINIQIAVRIFLAQMLQVGGLPFDVKSKEFNPDYPPETIEALQETLDIEAGKIPAKRYHSAQELFEANNAKIVASENAISSENTASEKNTESENKNSEKQRVEENASPFTMRTPKKKIVLGVARGKYDIPADIDGCNDEIATMFGVKSKDNGVASGNVTPENTTSENTADIASEACEHSINGGYISGRFDDLILADLLKEGYEGEALLEEFKIRRENRKLKAAVHRAIRVTNNSFQKLGINATLEDALGERYAVSDEETVNAESRDENSSDPECDRTPSGEFDDLILADLIKEGYEGEALLAEFRIRRAEIRPAVENLLQQADDAANGIGEYSTYEEVFGKR